MSSFVVFNKVASTITPSSTNNKVAATITPINPVNAPQPARPINPVTLLPETYAYPSIRKENQEVPLGQHHDLSKNEHVDADLKYRLENNFFALHEISNPFQNFISLNFSGLGMHNAATHYKAYTVITNRQLPCAATHVGVNTCTACGYHVYQKPVPASALPKFAPVNSEDHFDKAWIKFAIEHDLYLSQLMSYAWSVDSVRAREEGFVPIQLPLMKANDKKAYYYIQNMEDFIKERTRAIQELGKLEVRIAAIITHKYNHHVTWNKTPKGVVTGVRKAAGHMLHNQPMHTRAKLEQTLEKWIPNISTIGNKEEIMQETLTWYLNPNNNKSLQEHLQAKRKWPYQPPNQFDHIDIDMEDEEMQGPTNTPAIPSPPQPSYSPTMPTPPETPAAPNNGWIIEEAEHIEHQVNGLHEEEMKEGKKIARKLRNRLGWLTKYGTMEEQQEFWRQKPEDIEWMRHFSKELFEEEKLKSKHRFPEPTSHPGPSNTDSSNPWGPVLPPTTIPDQRPPSQASTKAIPSPQPSPKTTTIKRSYAEVFSKVIASPEDTAKTPLATTSFPDSTTPKPNKKSKTKISLLPPRPSYNLRPRK